jgi:hypothetical protein
MSRLVPILIFNFLVLPLWAQQPVGVVAQGNAEKFEFRAGTDDALFVTDSLSGKARRNLERLQVKKTKAEAKLARLNPQRRAAMLQSQAKHKLDSLTLISNPNAWVAQTDSLNPNQQISSYHLKLDSLSGKLSSKMDSLARLPNPNQFAIKSLDSLRTRLDSVRANLPISKINNAQVAVNGRVGYLTAKADAWEAKVNQKLALFNQNGANVGNVNLPGANNVSLPSLPVGEMPGLSFPVTPGLELPSNQLPDLSLPQGELPDVNVPQASVPGLQTGKFGEISQPLSVAGGAVGDIKKIREGNMEELQHVPETLEKKLLELDEMEGLEKEMTESMEQAERLRKWKSDPNYARELAVMQAKEQMGDHFAGRAEELKAAMQQLNKLKAKKKDAEGVVDLFKPNRNDLKGKPFRDRLLPGLSLQFQNSTNQWFDFNLYLGYRISGKITAGAGWVERISENLKEWEYHPEERAYGPRAFGEFKIKGGLHARAEAEYLNAQVTSPYLKQQDVTGRAWVWSYFAGMKQSFNYSKSLKGNVQVMYNLYNPEKRSPYVSRLNVRIGIEIPMKKPAAEKITTH